MKPKFNRRTLMRGALGGVAVSIALPPLDILFNTNGNAYADGSPLIRRMGLFYWGDGNKVDRWVPAVAGAAWTPSMALQPLADLKVKEYVNVATGFNLKTGDSRQHHAGAVGIASGGPYTAQPHPNSNYMSTFTYPSIDQVVAAQVGTATQFKSLEVGISRRTYGAEGSALHYLSHNGPDNFNPPEYDPLKVFNRVFGASFKAPGGSGVGAPSGPTVTDATKALRVSLLDAVGADIKALKAQVGSSDRIRLDKHFENIQAIERRLTGAGSPASSTAAPAAAGAGCALPTAPASVSGGGFGTPENLSAITKTMSDLVAMALACDQTRVFTMMFSGGVGGTAFSDVPGWTGGHHDMTHNEAGDQPMVAASTVIIVRQFATLLAALKAIPEGAGNLLDNAAVMAYSDVSDGKTHSIKDLPMLVGGRGGGFFKYPGVHYRSTTGENVSMIPFSMLLSQGLKLTQFGYAGGMVTTSAKGIEA